MAMNLKMGAETDAQSQTGSCFKAKHEKSIGAETGKDIEAPKPDRDVEAGSISDQLAILPQIMSKRGTVFLWLALGLLCLVFFLDNSTTYTYFNYAASSFSQFSLVAGINTAGIILNAVVQPPIAKISDVIGRGPTILACIVIQITSYCVMAASSSMNMLAGSMIMSVVGSSGSLVLGQIVVSDYTSSRTRALGIATFYVPTIITPFISSTMIEAVVTGIGWRWGVGIFAILYPACGICLVALLCYYERKARRLNVAAQAKMTVVEFCSQIDLGGDILIITSFGLILLPIALAGTAVATWHTPYVPALIGVGGFCLFAFFAYEHWIATCPILPLRYLKNRTIVSTLFIGFLDYFANNVTHAYLYSWAVVARNMSAGAANNLTFISTVSSCAVGLVVGLVTYKLKKFKWIVFLGCIIRTVGYGVMMRLRGVDNSVAELFIVQIIQGIGFGIMETLLIVAIQIVVPHKEMAQVTGLLQLSRFGGAAIGYAVAGSIYNNMFQEEIRKALGPNVNETMVATVFNSISGVLPDWGTAERSAITYAYGQVMRYMIIGSVAVSVPMLGFTVFLPDLSLTSEHNLA